MNLNTETQTGLLLKNLLSFYSQPENIQRITEIVKGESSISLRIIDWFVTNYSKKYYTVYNVNSENEERFKVYTDYKLKLKAYSKRCFDPFARWERISIPCGENNSLTTTIGQLNFFKWAITNRVLDYLIENYKSIESDMIERNTTSKKKRSGNVSGGGDTKTRKKREELSESACKTVKREIVDIVIKFK